ncbi:penicillin-binding transpeptidase domain-containing protein [Streptomyces sp. NPDC005438]|uniref:penicillin-binding transpeptidase domain-containing protein n=1 Tax=Streptomyces sp. NPDC005438 TaxID=3156880 RepID=UPI00339EBA65
MALIGGAVALVVAGTGIGAYTVVSGDGKGGDSANSPLGGGGSEDKPRTGPLTATEVRTTASDFLKAWGAGDTAKAARLTDDRPAAAKALSRLSKEARLAKVTLSQKPAVATPKDDKDDKANKAEGDDADQAALSAAKQPRTTVPFAVTASLKLAGKGGDAGETGEAGEGVSARGAANWSYDSSLTVVRKKGSGDPVVRWQPSVLHPKLKSGERITTDATGTPPIKAVDRSGKELTKEDHPSLAGVLADLRKRYGKKTDGEPGVTTHVVDSKGKAGLTLREHSKGTPGTLKTTIDLNLQKTAERAVAGKSKAAVVAVKPSTGEILAVANAPAGGFNTALNGSYAPGSTMKVVSSAMLLDKGLASPGRAHPCPKYATFGGWKFQNLDKFQIKGGTFSQSFARSCNTAFITQAKKLSPDDLGKEARDVFGIGLNWQVGTSTFDGRVPTQSGAQMAASLIGQGGVRMNPLTMASVAATVQSGTFRQPVIVSPSLDNRTLAKAPRAMKPKVAQELQGLMRLTASSGTAAKAMAGLSGAGAKTGSAEVDGQKKPDAWFTAYRGDLAVAAVVPSSGHGGDNAGPVVRNVLSGS